jgi:hypothetical protein
MSMADGSTSHIHLDPDAINALLEQMVNATGKAHVVFRDGRFHATAQGLNVVVEQIIIDATGLDIRLTVAGSSPAAGGSSPAPAGGTSTAFGLSGDQP